MTIQPPAAPATAGLILAGGLARRMGGSDKALLRVGGRTILDRTAERLARGCVVLLLNANGDPGRFAEAGLPIVPDEVPDRPGPLAGVLAGLDWVATRRPDVAWVATATADAPFLPRDLVPRLHLARSGSGARLACARTEGRLHPLHALWPVPLRDELRRALAGGQREARGWMENQGLAVADWPAKPLDPFFNVNTPADLAEAERLAEADEPSRPLA